jgi:hypothetical protein
MLGYLNTHGMESVRTEGGTFFKQIEIKPNIVDDAAFFAWIKENDAFDAMQRRVAVGFVKQFMEAHNDGLPPGLAVSREAVVRVRKPQHDVSTHPLLDLHSVGVGRGHRLEQLRIPRRRLPVRSHAVRLDHRQQRTPSMTSTRSATALTTRSQAGSRRSSSPATTPGARPSTTTRKFRLLVA